MMEFSEKKFLEYFGHIYNKVSSRDEATEPLISVFLYNPRNIVHWALRHEFFDNLGILEQKMREENAGEIYDEYMELVKVIKEENRINSIPTKDSDGDDEEVDDEKHLDKHLKQRAELFNKMYYRHQKTHQQSKNKFTLCVSSKCEWHPNAIYDPPSGSNIKTFDSKQYMHGIIECTTVNDDEIRIENIYIRKISNEAGKDTLLRETGVIPFYEPESPESQADSTLNPIAYTISFKFLFIFFWRFIEQNLYFKSDDSIFEYPNSVSGIKKISFNPNSNYVGFFKDIMSRFNNHYSFAVLDLLNNMSVDKNGPVIMRHNKKYVKVNGYAENLYEISKADLFFSHEITTNTILRSVDTWTHEDLVQLGFTGKKTPPRDDSSSSSNDLMEINEEEEEEEKNSSNMESIHVVLVENIDLVEGAFRSLGQVSQNIKSQMILFDNDGYITLNNMRIYNEILNNYQANLLEYVFNDHAEYESSIYYDGSFYNNSLGVYNDDELPNIPGMLKDRFEKEIATFELTWETKTVKCDSKFKLRFGPKNEQDLDDFLDEAKNESRKSGFKKSVYFDKNSFKKYYKICIYDRLTKKIVSIGMFNISELYPSIKGIYGFQQASMIGDDIEKRWKTVTSRSKWVYLSDIFTLDNYTSSGMENLLDKNKYFLDPTKKGPYSLGLASFSNFAIMRIAVILSLHYFDVCGFGCIAAAPATGAIMTKAGVKEISIPRTTENMKLFEKRIKRSESDLLDDLIINDSSFKDEIVMLRQNKKFIKNEVARLKANLGPFPPRDIFIRISILKANDELFQTLRMQRLKNRIEAHFGMLQNSNPADDEKDLPILPHYLKNNKIYKEALQILEEKKIIFPNLAWTASETILTPPNTFRFINFYNTIEYDHSMMQLQNFYREFSENCGFLYQKRTGKKRGGDDINITSADSNDNSNTSNTSSRDNNSQDNNKPAKRARTNAKCFVCGKLGNPEELPQGSTIICKKNNCF